MVLYCNEKKQKDIRPKVFISTLYKAPEILSRAETQWNVSIKESTPSNKVG